MGPVTGVILFFLIWWTALFAVLPFGHQRDQDGTPVLPNMKKKLLWTTVVAALIWCIVFAMIKVDMIDFRDIADQMVQEDLER